jgi:hypothetical protein
MQLYLINYLKEHHHNIMFKELINPSIFLYQTPGSGFSSQSTPSNYQLRFYYLARIEDGGKYTNTPDVVFRFLPALTSGCSLLFKYYIQT